MIDESWKNQFKKWKNLKPYQIKLIDEGPSSQSQAWLLNSMWCEWKGMKKIKDTELPEMNNFSGLDPWEQK